MLIGTTVNALAILAGSTVGLLFAHAARRGTDGSGLGERLRTTLMNGVALCVLYIGVSGCLDGQSTRTAIISMVLGALAGEMLDLDRRMQALGGWEQEKTKRLPLGGSASSVSEGFVTASLLFCVGAMAIVGSLQDGLTGDHSTLFAKALLDGVSAVVFASSLGIGVAFSALSILVLEGTVALLASLLTGVLTEAVITEISVTGSLLIIGIGLNVLGLTKLRIMNMAPALLLPILLCRFM